MPRPLYLLSPLPWSPLWLLLAVRPWHDCRRQRAFCVRFITSLRIVLQMNCQEESRTTGAQNTYLGCRWQGATGRGNFGAVLATRRERLRATLFFDFCVRRTFVSCVETRLSTQVWSVGKLGDIAQGIVFATCCRVNKEKPIWASTRTI